MNKASKWILTILSILLALAAVVFVLFFVFNFNGRTPTIGVEDTVASSEVETEDPNSEVPEVVLGEDVTDEKGSIVENASAVDTGVANKNGDVESVIIEYPNGAKEVN